MKPQRHIQLNSQFSPHLDQRNDPAKTRFYNASTQSTLYCQSHNEEETFYVNNELRNLPVPKLNEHVSAMDEDTYEEVDMRVLSKNKPG